MTSISAQPPAASPLKNQKKNESRHSPKQEMRVGIIIPRYDDICIVHPRTLFVPRPAGAPHTPTITEPYSPSPTLSAIDRLYGYLYGPIECIKCTCCHCQTHRPPNPPDTGETRLHFPHSLRVHMVDGERYMHRGTCHVFFYYTLYCLYPLYIQPEIGILFFLSTKLHQ